MGTVTRAGLLIVKVCGQQSCSLLLAVLFRLPCPPSSLAFSCFEALSGNFYARRI
jgi:hypothetical protein